MSEDLKPADPILVCGWTKLFHPKGPLVTIPVPCCSDPALMLDYVSRCLDAGFLVAAPGLEAGEQKESIGWVVQRSKENDDGSVTPIVDLYPANEAMKWSILSVYLNRPAQVEDFEHASKMKLSQIPPYVGAGKLERGASKQTDRMIVPVPKPFEVVLKDNPKYNPDETDATKKKPKRLFVRWAIQRPDGQQAAQDAPGATNGTPAYAEPVRKPKSALESVKEAMREAKQAGLTPEGWAALAIEFGVVQSATGWNFDGCSSRQLNDLARRLEDFVTDPVANDSVPF